MTEQKKIISEDDVRHIARLACIACSEEELEPLTRELQSILGYIEQLNAVETDGVSPTTHMSDAEDTGRDDIPEDRDAEETEALVNAAPFQEGGEVKVRAVFDA